MAKGKFKKMRHFTRLDENGDIQFTVSVRGEVDSEDSELVETDAKVFKGDKFDKVKKEFKRGKKRLKAKMVKKRAKRKKKEGKKNG